jgi:predicted RNase H-like HicB family nuclease
MAKYPIKLFYSTEDEGYIAVVPDLPGCSAFGTTEAEALKEVRIAQELWLKAARKDRRAIPKPSSILKFSGKILVRAPRTLHAELVERAKEEGLSLNQLIVYLLGKATGGADGRKTAARC